MIVRMGALASMQQDETSVLDQVLYIAQVVLIIAGLASLILAPLRLLLRGPRIEIRPVPWEIPTQWAFAHVEVRNRPLPGLLAWLFSRDAALDASAEVEFRRDGALEIGPVPARWSDRPEPFRHNADPNTGRVVGVYAPDLAVESKWWNLPPTKRGFGIAAAIVRQDGTAHAWGAESYMFPDWRNPAWELRPGQYDVTIRVTWSDRSAERTFRLPFTPGTPVTFRLT